MTFDALRRFQSGKATVLRCWESSASELTVALQARLQWCASVEQRLAADFRPGHIRNGFTGCIDGCRCWNVSDQLPNREAVAGEYGFDYDR
jgi:hypothetical protein